MNLRSAKRLKPGDRVFCRHHRFTGTVIKTEPDDDPRVQLLVTVKDPNGKEYELNYKLVQ